MASEMTERHLSIDQETVNSIKAIVPNGTLISSLFSNLGELVLFHISLYCRDLPN